MVFRASVQISIELWSLASWELERTQGNWSPMLKSLVYGPRLGHSALPAQKAYLLNQILNQKLGFGAPDLLVQIRGSWPPGPECSCSYPSPYSKAWFWRPRLSGSDWRVMANWPRRFMFLLKSLFKSLDLESPAIRFRFEAPDHLVQTVHFLIQILIRKLDLGAPGLQIQIWASWTLGTEDWFGMSGLIGWCYVVWLCYVGCLSSYAGCLL